MKKALSIILVLLMVGAIFTGCEPKSKAGTGKEIQVGVCIYKYDDTYISSVREALEKLEKDNHGTVKLNMNDGKGDQGVQNDQIDTMIQKGVDVLLVNLVDVGAASSVIEKIKKADIPVVFFNREPSAEILKTYEKACFIGTNAKDAGVIQGEIIADIWGKADPKVDRNGDGVMQYVMFQGEPDNPEAVARTKWSIQSAEEKGVKTEKLELQVCNWQVDLAQNAMEAWLTKYGDKIEFVVANNDDMARGAVAALQAQGYNKGDAAKTTPVIGVDATVPAQDLISKGFMTASVLQDGVGMAKALYESTINVAQGKSAIENTDYKFDDSGVAIRIPYQKFAKK